MQTPLLDGIAKCAFTFTGGRTQYRPWGGTTADVGSSYEGNMAVNMLGYELPKRIGMTGRLASKAGGPVAGLAEFGYGMTKGVSDARKKGRTYGRELGKTNPFLAARL